MTSVNDVPSFLLELSEDTSKSYFERQALIEAAEILKRKLGH